MKTKVLIIDDLKLITNLIKFDLQNAGFDVEINNSGIRGLNSIRNNEFDILVLDVEMPDINGLDILRIIRTDKKIKNLKIIVFTSFAHYKEEAMLLKCDAFLLKPFTSKTIIETINELMKTNNIM